MEDATTRAFEAELTRLLAKGLTQEEEVIARRYYSQKERKGMPSSAFCGPHRTFPVETQEDVDNAARLMGHAEDPAAIKSCVKGKAKANGWSLPDAWKDEDSKERSMGAELAQDALARAAASHEPMKTKHSHPHPSYGSQGDDGSHEHDHEHGKSGEPDNNHEPSDEHQHDSGNRAAMPDLIPAHAYLYAPITRIDKEKREVEGVATSEAVDSFGTIFSYEGSKKAFQKWIQRTANCREMHERRAVGKGVGVFFDDANKQIIVRSRVSRSADGDNTWTKLEEGILNGLSVGAARDSAVWGTTERNGKIYPYLQDYELSELSYVDNASNPDAHGLAICRADGLTELVDTTEEAAAPTAPAPITRAGARVSAPTRDAMHDNIGHSLKSAAGQMKNCGCDTCASSLKMLDPDGDNDIDLGGYADTDGDSDSLYSQQGDAAMDRAAIAALERVLPGVIERMFAPVYQRQQQLLARMAQTPEEPTPQPLDTTALEERLTSAIVERVASASSLSELRADLSAVKEAVERIDRQPAVGLAPILNGSRPIDKSFALDRVTQPAAPAGPPPAGVMQQALSMMQGGGLLDTQDMQIKAAALLLQQQQGR